jgi:C4-dicarboxylate transporter DctM subunit
MILPAIVILVALMALSIPVATSMGLLGLSLSSLYSKLPLTLAAGEVAWSTSTNFILVSIPLFILLGEILLRSGMAEKMYNAMVQWLSWIPGGLMHSNIGACTMFAATSGSSVATAATIGTVALQEVKKHGYSERLFLGSLAAGGTLGILIPPSINMIVYGVLTNTSVPQLYLAGFIPGFILASLFMLTILIGCLWRPEWGGRRIETDWSTRIRSLPDLIPPLLIFLVVVGSIYLGIATPTEAAALGVIGALVLAAWNRRLTWKAIVAAIEGTMKTTAMVMAILVAAYFLNFVITSIGLTDQVNRFIVTLGLTPFQTLMVVIGFYVILGMFMETLSMMVATVPIIAPVIIGLGYDPVWFGIIIILLVETAMITPPVGINLYVVQGIRRGGQINDVLIGSAPFVVTLLVMIGILVAFPDIALWMPKTFGH